MFICTCMTCDHLMACCISQAAFSPFFGHHVRARLEDDGRCRDFGRKEDDEGKEIREDAGELQVGAPTFEMPHLRRSTAEHVVAVRARDLPKMYEGLVPTRGRPAEIPDVPLLSTRVPGIRQISFVTSLSSFRERYSHIHVSISFEHHGG